MVEYSMITWLLAVGLILGSTVRVFPAGPRLQKNVIELFLDAYQIYYDSFYFALNMPFP